MCDKQINKIHANCAECFEGIDRVTRQSQWEGKPLRGSKIGVETWRVIRHTELERSTTDRCCRESKHPAVGKAWGTGRRWASLKISEQVKYSRIRYHSLTSVNWLTNKMLVLLFFSSLKQHSFIKLKIQYGWILYSKYHKSRVKVLAELNSHLKTFEKILPPSSVLLTEALFCECTTEIPIPLLAVSS